MVTSDSVIISMIWSEFREHLLDLRPMQGLIAVIPTINYYHFVSGHCFHPFVLFSLSCSVRPLLRRHLRVLCTSGVFAKLEADWYINKTA